MRNSCLFACIFLIPAIKLSAQNNPIYKSFKAEIGFGMVINQNGSTGGEVKINPSYTIADRYKLGIQFEAVVYNNESTGSSMLTFDYYFIRNTEFRISGGGGYGFYNSSSFDVNQASTIPELNKSEWTTGKMGGMIRIGFERHHLSLGIAYNFVPTMYVSTSINGYPTTTGYLTSTDSFKNGFFGLTLGIIIGGGKK